MTCFRGEVAAASLKLGQPAPAPALFPGFRGEVAAASLKQIIPVSSDFLQSGFRGEVAAASLKLILEDEKMKNVNIVSAAKSPRPH